MSKIRVSREGDAGTNGGPAGDLYVVLHVKASDYFKREGNDVYTRLDITPSQAALGDNIVIKTLDGEKQITVQAGVQSGNSIKLKGLGVPFVSRPSQRGDHIVVVAVKTPTKLSEEEKILYRKLYEIQTNKKSHQSSVMDKVKGVFNV
jgi:molecular chaperone DnaJ